MLSAKGNASFFGFGPKGAQAFDFSGHERKKCFLNDRGRGMVEASYLSGFDSEQDGRTIAQADLDNDGRPELLVAMRDHPLFHVWALSQGEPRGHVLGLDVRSPRTPNRDAVGAEVRATCAGHTVTRLLAVGTGFAAQDSHTLTIGVGECQTVDLKVRFPSRLEKVFRAVRTDQFYRVDEEGLHPVQGVYGQAGIGGPAPVGGDSARSPLALALSGGKAYDAGGSQAWSPRHDLVYLDLWASWCEACARNQPVINALSRRFADRVDFVGLSMEPSDNETVVAGHARSAVYPLLISPPLLRAAQGLVGEKPPLPSTLLISRSSGKVLWQSTGVATVSDLERAIEP